MAVNFWDLHEEYYARVRHFALARVRDPWAAEDLVQETFIRVQESLGSLRDPAKAQSWIFRIAANLCSDYFRSRKNDPTAPGDSDQPDLPTAILPVDQLLEQDQMGRCVQDKMLLLPDNFREVLALRELMEFSYQEIAEILQISVSNVKVSLHRARSKMKAVLEEHCQLERDGRDVLVCTPKGSRDKGGR